MIMYDDRQLWDLVATEKDRPTINNPRSIYLHKKKDLLRLIHGWAKDYIRGGIILKTDLMEESLRDDDVLFELAQDAAVTFGMDISPRLAALARQRSIHAAKHIAFVSCDARNLCFKDETFDFILSNSTLDHFPEIEQGLAEIRRTLKPEGVAVITLHSKLDFTFFLYHVIKKLTGFAPHWHFERTYTPWDAQKILNRCGFIVDDFATTTHIPMGLWAFFQVLYFCASRAGKKWACAVEHFIERNVEIMDALAKRETVLNYATGLLIGFKVRKKR